MDVLDMPHQRTADAAANVFLPKDRISGTHQGFGFCEFLAEQDADYAVKIMNQIKLYGKPIRVSRASYDTKKVDIGANLFIGNLDENVDESQLYDTFQTFGSVSEQPKVSANTCMIHGRVEGHHRGEPERDSIADRQIARDPTTGQSKGYGFIAYHEFEAADMAIENMNGQFFGGKQINVQYAFKKDGKGERHGTQAERLMAAQAK